MELLTVESTQKIIEESNKLYEENNKKYYRDVLDFLNLLFEDNSKNLINLKFKKITLNENVFNLYNDIIKTYKLNKPEFDSNNFDLSELDDPEEIKNIFYEIAQRFSNNLLEKINYKLKKKFIKNENKNKFILEYVK